MTTLSAASATIDVPELSDLVHEKTLASARFMKSIRARTQNGFVFVKAVMKPYPSFQVQKYVKKLPRNVMLWLIHQMLSDIKELSKSGVVASWFASISSARCMTDSVLAHSWRI